MGRDRSFEVVNILFTVYPLQDNESHSKVAFGFLLGENNLLSTSVSHGPHRNNGKPIAHKYTKIQILFEKEQHSCRSIMFCFSSEESDVNDSSIDLQETYLFSYQRVILEIIPGKT